MDENYYKIQNIYDLMIYAYIWIREKEENHLENYFNQVQDEGTIQDVTTLFRELVNRNILIEDFLKELKRFLEEEPEKIWIHLMLEFDRYYSEFEHYPLFKIDDLRIINELSNENNITDEWRFYSMFQDNFVMNSDVMSKAKKRRIENGIWEYIKSYRIIKTEIRVSITRYQNPSLKNLINEKRSLRIAVIPYSDKCCFEEDPETGQQKIKKYDEEQHKIIKKNCELLLDQLRKEDVNIIVFPELVMDKEIIDHIKQYVISQTVRGSSIKLLFMGSYYEEGINQCLLLTGTGKEIIRNQKHNGYKYKDSKGREHRESLGDFVSDINLADIKGIGRVWYLICKDAIVFDQNVKITNNFGINVQVISSYSKSVSEFKKTGESLATIYALFSLMCNACSARKCITDDLENTELGVISYPIFETKKKSILGYSTYYQCGAMKEKCDYCQCAHIFDLDLASEMVIERTEMINMQNIKREYKGVKISHTQVHFDL